MAEDSLRTIMGEAEYDKALRDIRAINAKAEEQERLRKVAKLKEVLPYEDTLAQEICERIAIGELLINICEAEHLPSMRRCNQWLREQPEFAALYQSAISDRLMISEEEVIKIADDVRSDFKTVIKGGREKRVQDPEMVQRAKLRIDVRFKHLKAYKPQRWGDVSTLITKSADDFDTSNMSPEELERQIADIERKSRPAKAA